MQPRQAISSQKSRRSLAVLLGFLLFIAVSMLVAWGTSGLSSPQESCTRKCLASGRNGVLVYPGPATSKDFYKEANSECRCQ